MQQIESSSISLICTTSKGVEPREHDYFEF